MTRPRDPQGRFVKAITASVSTIPTRSLEKMPRAAQAWQERAWRLWRILGVLHFPTSFKAKQVGRLGWKVTVDGKELDEKASTAALEAITGPNSVRETSRRLALNLEIAGEVFYARAADEWRVYSPTTPQLKEKLKAADIVVRGWQSDPEDPDIATSSVQAALATAEQIRLMAALSRGQDRNRLAQRGILLVPKESKFPEGDDFQAKLEEAMTAPIADEYAPSAVVPLKVEVPGETIEKWRHLVLESDYDEKLMERIEKSVHQLALELDMPPEMLLGNMDSNHWNAWLSDESNYSAHVEPLGALTGEVYADAMMAAVDDAVEVLVVPDPANLLARRATVEDAFAALKLAAVGFDFVRDAIGATDEDKPSDEEIALILQVTGNAQAAVPEQGPPEEPDDPTARPDVEPNGNGVTAAVDDSDQALDALGRQLLALDMQLLGTLRGEARMAVELAMEKHDTEDIGAQERIASEMGRLGRAWRKDISEAHLALRDLGIEAKGPAWKQAAEVSVALLVDGMTVYVTENLGKTASEMPALPTPLLREVMAAAGGSNTATVAAVSPTFQDPQGFAIGVLSVKGLKAEGIELKQWRFRYGSLPRSDPFLPHKEQDGRFASSEGVVHGWFPGDHR